MDKISIIVPCYKVEKYIEQCVSSLTGQTYKNIEIILVDDGSPDKTGAMCDELAQKDSRIHVIHKRNGGVSAARNDGLSEARGEYIIFVDSDDYVPLDAYENMISCAVETGADMVIGDIIKVNDQEEQYAQFFAEPFLAQTREDIDNLVCTVMYKNYCPNPPSSGPAYGYGGPTNKLIRREILVNNSIHFDTRLKGIYDDIVYSMYATACSGKIAYVNKPVYYYRLVQGSLTHSFKQDMPEIAKEILNAVEEFLAKYDQKGSYRKAYYALCIRIISYCLRRYYCNRNNRASVLKLASELKRVMNSEPYVTAAKQAEVEKLTKGQQGLIKLLKMKAALLTILYYRSISSAT